MTEAVKATYPNHNPKKLIERALKHFETIAQADTTIIRGWCLEAYRDLYRRMIEIGDYANALRAVKELHRIAR